MDDANSGDDTTGRNGTVNSDAVTSDGAANSSEGGQEKLVEVSSELASKLAIWVEPGVSLAEPTTLPAGWAALDIAGLPRGAIAVSSGIVPAVACPSGFACLYQNGSEGGSAVRVQNGIGIGNLKGIACGSCTNGTHGNDGTFNDQMTSWVNVSGRQYCWWFNAGNSGEVHVMLNGIKVNVATRENDQASSFGPC
jgi:hypothetical protein